jgi:hypothetical protein
MQTSEWRDDAGAPQAFLGEPVAIKAPTAAAFPRVGGANLLIVGQQDEAALGILAACVASLALAHPSVPSDAGPAVARFFVFDGGLADAPGFGVLGRIASRLPHAVQVVDRRDVARAIGEIYDEVQARGGESSGESSAWYVVVRDLARFRDLRKGDDDFGFGARVDGGRPGAAAQFAAILRDGPAVGVHVLAWCDTLNNLLRTLDRQALREFESRVVFQMSAADSSHLIDNPIASRLGLHRALLVAEDQGKLEKFRPYALPDEAWLERLADCLAQRLRPVPNAAD